MTAWREWRARRYGSGCSSESPLCSLRVAGLGTAADGKRGCFAVAIERAWTEAARSELAVIVKFSWNAIIGIALDSSVASWNPGVGRLYSCTAEEAMVNPFSTLLLRASYAT